MSLRLGDRNGVRVNKVSKPGIAADHDKLLKCRTRATGFKQPEQAFNCHIHDLVRSFLAGGQMDERGLHHPSFFLQLHDARSIHGYFVCVRDVPGRGCDIMLER